MHLQLLLVIRFVDSYTITELPRDALCWKVRLDQNTRIKTWKYHPNSTGNRPKLNQGVCVVLQNVSTAIYQWPRVSDLLFYCFHSLSSVNSSMIGPLTWLSWTTFAKFSCSSCNRLDAVSFRSVARRDSSASE